MTVNVSRSITRHVRGLHLAVITHNRTGAYHGNGMLVPQAVQLARQGQFAKSRQMLRELRSNGRDRTDPRFGELATYCNADKHVPPYPMARMAFLTPAAAKLLNVDADKIVKRTTKAVSVLLSKDEIKALRLTILELQKTAKSNDMRLLNAAWTAINNA